MIVQRCHNPMCRDYQYYGGKGIQVCERWRASDGFENFLADVGPQPAPCAGLRRLDSSGDFAPGNVTWGEGRPGRVLSRDGHSQSVAQWARELGLKEGTLRARLRKGWPVERALGKRVGPRAPYGWWRQLRKAREESNGPGIG
jgi:hypothetical protein